MAEESSSSPKLLGVPSYGYVVPLWKPLSRRSKFTIVHDVPAHLARRLRERKLSAALLTPIDYARDYAMYRIIRDAAVSSIGASGTILLNFRSGLHDIQSIAFDPSSSSEVVLAKIVLAEKYELTPAVIPVIGTLEEMLAKADAALMLGDPTRHHERETMLDIVEEWTDIADVPYVHNVWVSREHELSSDQINLIRQAPTSIQDGSSPAKGNDEANRLSFSLSEDGLGGLNEFLRMAYYHKILQDMPDLKLFRKNEL